MTNHETTACRTTQHCAFHGWCRRCDPAFAAVMSRVNVAIQRTDADDTHWGPLYAAVAEALRPAAVSVPPPAPQAADRRARYAAAIAEGFRAFDADTTSDAYLDAELLDAVVAVADAEEAELLAAVPVVPPAPRADDQAAVLEDRDSYHRWLKEAETARDEARLQLSRVIGERNRLAAEVDNLLQQEADRIVAHCPDHGTADGAWMDCHCAVADDMRRNAVGPCVAGEQQNETPEARRCVCPHPADEHSVYGCVDGCGCEWMPKRAAKGA